MSSDDQFRQVYAATFEPLLGYALRRVEQPADAADVVAETFLIAWRRRAEMPPPEQIRLWLYGVARRVLANHHRGGDRRRRLGEKLRRRLTSWSPDPAVEVPERLAVRDALARLGDLDREVLTLTVWEGLRPGEIAQVLGVRPATVRARLARARARLRELVGDDPRPPGHVWDVLIAPTPEEGR
ncbi:RNA polymerase sigma factor [Actinoplanes teichomyceticus]|uniref:RNA polymerase ECF family sigma subunit n=1 Tax=Actinoplanes teichomyceticus TaxID=1867 RepID=A0A561VL83_ACTTI|nr:sigma-70 family RNA polymerase sigma factor [Actinoplanes teichomyceticus]TWG12372.1 RNA polymerase ECF family sigma subunit [Actinoplanes teichomyceticus]GIF13732.1 DNA-directed RNA polymerase sigma-70 factor [Actinoplanes teichomyceticus]